MSSACFIVCMVQWEEIRTLQDARSHSLNPTGFVQRASPPKMRTSSKEVSHLCCFQGTPIVGADVLEEPSLADFVSRLMQLRSLLSKSLQPPSYEPAQDLHWHGAYPGVLLLPQGC